MKEKTSLFDKLVVWIFFLVSILGFFVCLWAIAPIIDRNISGDSTQGTISSIKPFNDEYKLNYTYSNKFDGKSYDLVERINSKEYSKVENSREINVVYGELFPKRVYLPLLENDIYSAIVLIIGLFLTVVIFYRALSVIREKLSPRDFIGTKKRSSLA